MAPRVSIVITAFNRAQYLRQCIDSCLEQTEPCEVIVCDHGSTDDTPNIAASYGDKIVYIRRERDCGMHFCWLEGVLHASHEFVHIQHDDDWLKPDFIATCMQFMTEETGFVFSLAGIYEEEHGKVTHDTFHQKTMPKDGIYPMSHMRHFLTRYDRITITPACVIYRKQDLIDGTYIGKLPNQRTTFHGVGQDMWCLLLCLLRYKKVGHVRKPLSICRAHSDSITFQAKADAAQEKIFMQAYAEVKQYYRFMRLQQLHRRYNPFAKVR